MMEQVLEQKNFYEASTFIAQEFIQTVVAVDDQMSFGSRPIVDDAIELDAPEESDTGLGIQALSEESDDLETQSGNEDGQDTSEDGAADQDSAGHKLYYRDLSSSFAKKGIVCSGLTPFEDSEKTIELICSSSKNADITILDWQMDEQGESGGLATGSILRIIEEDLAEGGRLRLISVYTAENIDEVLQTLERTAKKLKYECSIDKNCLRFSSPELLFCKIEVVSKLDIEEGELSDHVVQSFAKLTAGLLSNAALSSIADIRDKTHNLLFKFNQKLDPAYLSHVLGLLSSPDMREQAHQVAFDYAAELISEEIKSTLQTSARVKKSLSKEAISLWPEHVNNEGEVDFFGITVGGEEEIRFGTDRMLGLLSFSSKEELKVVLDQEPKIADVQDAEQGSLEFFERSPVQVSAQKSSVDEHLELSALECVRRDAKSVEKNHAPSLKQGVILKSKKKYYICLQPLCDSIRLKSETAFMFLNIRCIGPTSAQPFSHVVRKSEGFLKFNIRPSSSQLATFKFKPCDETRVIKPLADSGNCFTFRDAAGQNFEWCGELKQPVSQAVVNSVAAQLSRVGLDSFEWLRLKQQR